MLKSYDLAKRIYDHRALQVHGITVNDVQIIVEEAYAEAGANPHKKMIDVEAVRKFLRGIEVHDDIGRLSGSAATLEAVAQMFEAAFVKPKEEPPEWFKAMWRPMKTDGVAELWLTIREHMEERKA